MKLRLTLAGVLLAAAGTAVASGGGALLHFEADTGNAASVQRGAANFMNYCSGCHSLRFLRYNRLATDMEIPEDLLQENLMFTSDKSGDHILSAMPSEEALKWFGQAPPDLSLTARARGSDWIYSFLKTFYVDDQKATGVNNLQLPGASMPHVLGGLEGFKQVAHDDGHGDTGGHGGGHDAPAFEMVHEGTMTEREYDVFVSDIVNFLSYAAEPGKAQMQSRGKWALFYLLFLIPLTYLIKKEFWKDVH